MKGCFGFGPDFVQIWHTVFKAFELMTVKCLQRSLDNIVSDRVFLECWEIICSFTAAKYLLEK